MTTAAVNTSTADNSILQNYLSSQASSIASSTASSSSSSSSSSQGVFQNESSFLNILTTQLKNQDPTATTDTNQFTQELVEFAGVEQQLNTNTDLQQLISLQKNSSGANAALSYIGGYAEVPTTTGQMSLQSSSSEIAYTLPTASNNVTVTIKDSSGNTVTTLNGSGTAGLSYLTWNGENSNGVVQPDGAYTFSVAATDAVTGATESITDTRFIGKVTGVSSNSDGTTNLLLGTVSIPSSSVDAVYTATSLPSSTTV